MRWRYEVPGRRRQVVAITPLDRSGGKERWGPSLIFTRPSARRAFCTLPKNEKKRLSMIGHPG